jgi:hypothetical protein
MDAAGFDRLTKRLSETGSRRRALQGLLSATLAVLAGTRQQQRATAKPCKGVGKRCQSNDDCCSVFCEPISRQCVATCTQGDGICDNLAPCAPGCSCYFVELDGIAGRACLQDPSAGTSLPTKECPGTEQCAPRLRDKEDKEGCPCSSPAHCPKGTLCTASSCCQPDSVCLPLCEPNGA